jgi:serine/alanine adding enzyme
VTLTRGIRPSSTGALDVVGPAEWDAHLARLGPTDTYYCAAYHRASALLEPAGTRPVLLAYHDDDGDVALPLLLRPLPDGDGWDATSAYGYGGPVIRGTPDLAGFGNALDAWAIENGVVATFLRMNPLLHEGVPVPPTALLVDVGSTVAWDVRPGRDLRSGLHSDQRRSVRKAENAGVEFRVVLRPPGLTRFRELYVETMRRQQAAEFFYFPDGYWEALTTEDEHLVPLLVEGRFEGRVISALLAFVAERWLHAHLTAGEEVARTLGAASGCYLAAAEWAQSRGLTAFHLGGGVGGSTESPLHAFKRRFDPKTPLRQFRVAKLVHDPARFRQLADTDSTDGFFPPWRRPA